MTLGKYQYPILLFDSECPLCLRFKQSLERVIDSEMLNYASIHDEAVYKVYPFLTKTACNEDVHLILSPDKVLVGADVIEYLIKDFPVVKKFTWLLDGEMGKKAVDLFHNSVKTYRKSLLKWCSKCR